MQITLLVLKSCVPCYILVMETNDRKISLKQTSNDEDFEMQPLVNGQVINHLKENRENTLSNFNKDQIFLGFREWTRTHWVIEDWNV